MLLGYLQTSPLFGNVMHNLVHVDRVLRGQRFDVMVLPELFSTGYVFEDRRELDSLAESYPGGQTYEMLKGVAKDKQSYIIAGVAEKEKDKIFNSAILVGPKGLMARYRKIHLFNKEKLYFDSGDLPFQVIETPHALLGMMICFDWIFPEAARALAMQGAHIICHPSNLVLAYCQKAMYARSVENRVYTVTCNRIGREVRAGNDLTFTGQSQILNPKGEILAQAGPDQEKVEIIEIDPLFAENKMITEFNHVHKDRRPEFYIQ